ncbi:hypothetical protein MERGE_000948 [Pneumocystis wakefieldiae]|uniref:SWI/SNF and RSC complexes subunit ssr4 n=1 Tax=Pneumocystis wakefieldiae TaxID=38082 RepID=A0A899G127_9ASCO|nr:hypothetical protein MERGE_000948 [Pneumocystis wakefieldiae]
MVETAQQYLVSSIPKPEWRSQVWCKSTLSYPVNPHLSIESITDMLLKAPGVVQKVPFVWNFIDKPVDGQIFLVWLSPESAVNPPPDGFQYMDSENCYRVDVGGNVFEHKYGFYPATESHTSRIRRRFRLVKGGNDQLWLIYYLRSSENDRLVVNTQTATPQPPRTYPLPFIQNKPFLFYESSTPQPSRSSYNSTTSNVPTRPMMYYNNLTSTQGNQSFQKNQYTSQSGGAHSASTHNTQPNMPLFYDLKKKSKTNSSVSTDQGSSNFENPLLHHSKAISEEEEPQGDELDFFTPRDISLARYMRHHDWMDEIFNNTFKISNILSSPLFPKSEDYTIEALKERLSNNEIQTMKDLHQKKINEIKFSNEAIWLNNAINDLNNAQNMEEIASITKTVEEKLKKNIRKVSVKEIYIKETNKELENSEVFNI